MENLSRKLEKELSNFTLPENSEIKKQQTLLLVDNYGNIKIKSVRWHKAVVILSVIMLYLTIAALGGVYVLYKKNKKFQDDLDMSEQQIKFLQTKNNMLTARLDKPQKKTSPLAHKKTSSKKRKKQSDRSHAKHPSYDTKDNQDEKREDKRPAEPLPVKPISDEADVRSVPDVVVEEDIPTPKPEEDIPKPEPVQTVQSLSIAVENFDISYYPRRKSLRVKFNIKNIDPDSNLISGYISVVLKTNQTDQGNWVLLPPGELVSGRPSGEEYGESFEISRFRTVQLEAKTQTAPEKFRTATVLIFDKTGKLLLEKDFPVEIN